MSDDLARKLHDEFIEAPADAWERANPATVARWERVAELAREVTSQTTLHNLEMLIRVSETDPEAAPFLPGLKMLAESWRRARAYPKALSYAEARRARAYPKALSYAEARRARAQKGRR